MIADWWPDDWDFPVGYHVTVPCQAEDASYRSFHQAFGLAGVDAEGVPVLAYQQDLLRDGALVDTNFGAGGLCRTTNFGMETLGVNTMRYCTQVPKNLASDYTVPGAPPAGARGDWSCSTSGDTPTTSSGARPTPTRTSQACTASATCCRTAPITTLTTSTPTCTTSGLGMTSSRTTAGGWAEATSRSPSAASTPTARARTPARAASARRTRASRARATPTASPTACARRLHGRRCGVHRARRLQGRQDVHRAGSCSSQVLGNTIYHNIRS